MRKFVSFFIFLLFVAYSAPYAQAISVTPAVIDVRVAASERNDFSFLVTNDEKETISYAFSIQKFVPQGESGQPNFLPPSDTSGLPDWLFLDAPSITLRPGESRMIPVSLRVPNDASSGGHYAAIFLTQTTLNSAIGQNITAIPRIGVLVFATIDGSIIEKAVLNDFSIERSSVSHLPITFRATLENRGNVHITPSVSVEVQNMFGKTVALLDANEEKGRILPSSARRFSAVWQKSSVDQGASLFHHLQEEWRNWGFGFYKAKILSSIKSGPLEIKHVSFQVWPWRTMLLVVAVMTLLIAVYRSLRNKR